MVEGIGDMDLENYDETAAASGADIKDEAVITFKQHKGRTLKHVVLIVFLFLKERGGRNPIEFLWQK